MSESKILQALRSRLAKDAKPLKNTLHDAVIDVRDDAFDRIAAAHLREAAMAAPRKTQGS